MIGMIGFAVLGVLLGAAGSEVLRAKNPKLINKVEEAAKRFADRCCPEKTGPDESQEQEEGSDV